MFLIGFLMTGFTSLRNLMIIVLCGIGLAGAVCGCSGKGVRPASAEELLLAVASLDSGRSRIAAGGRMFKVVVK